MSKTKKKVIKKLIIICCVKLAYIPLAYIFTYIYISYATINLLIIIKNKNCLYTILCDLKQKCKF
jgi:hypothetical protein